MDDCKPQDKGWPADLHQLPASKPIVVQCLLAPDMPVGSDEVAAIIRLLGADLDDILG
jgi:hypothetical protein